MVTLGVFLKRDLDLNADMTDLTDSSRSGANFIRPIYIS